MSDGCTNCYAIRVAAREMQEAHVGLTTRVDVEDGGPAAAGSEHTRIDWTGEVRLLPDRLDTPLHWRKPRRAFVGSMSDLFHPDVPEEFIEAVFHTMAMAPQHTFQILTKRPQRMATVVKADPELTDYYDVGGAWGAGEAFWPWRAVPLPNVWLGVSVENQRYADLRIPHLLATPAAVRFLSIEPMLGPVDLSQFLGGASTREGEDSASPDPQRLPPVPAGAEGRRDVPTPPTIGWVIVGGESGPGARPMQIEWAESLVEQCQAAGVPAFVKQLGTVTGGKQHHDIETFPESLRVREYPA